MALNFPGSPTNGQQYQGFVYNSAVQAWQSNPASVAPFYTADLPPTNPTVGDSWFNTNDGTMYIYTYDGNTYQWVEHRSEIAKSQVGLVPLIPASVQVGSGSATVSTSGLITFTGASSISLNGIFSSSYNYYRMVMEEKGTTGASVLCRFRASGTDATTFYSYGGYAVSREGATSVINGNNVGFIHFGGTTVYQGGRTMEIQNPARAVWTSTQCHAFDTSQLGLGITSGTKTTDDAFDGITIYPASGTLSGSFKIYRYN